MTNDIPKVAAGERVKASTINQLIDRYPTFRVDGDGSVDEHGTCVNLTINGGRRVERRGQRWREPFDLSTNNCLSGATELSVAVIRTHLPNDTGGFDDIPFGEPIVFPTNDEVKIYLCELSSKTQKVMSSEDPNLSAAESKKVLWTLGTNGVVLEDSRAAALGGGGEKIELDLSSLNWIQTSAMVDDEVVWTDTNTAQLWDYTQLKAGDIADSAELTGNNGWLFPVRPPDGEPHLKYVELSTLSSITGGGGGGHACSCELSATPPAVLSSLGQDLVQIADWTKDGWQTHVPILAPDVAKDVVQLFQWMAMTPFWYNQPTHQIRNNYFYNGRTFTNLADFTVSNAGYYYLKIEDNIYGVSPSFTIIHSNTAPNAIQNTDNITYYALWTINAELKAQFDWRLTWMLPRYSN